jgi:hypothetical protein
MNVKQAYADGFKDRLAGLGKSAWGMPDIFGVGKSQAELDKEKTDARQDHARRQQLFTDVKRMRADGEGSGADLLMEQENAKLRGGMADLRNDTDQRKYNAGVKDDDVANDPERLERVEGNASLGRNAWGYSKYVPLLGSATGAADAMNSVAQGDYKGALMDTGGAALGLAGGGTMLAAGKAALKGGSKVLGRIGVKPPARPAPSIANAPPGSLSNPPSGAIHVPPSTTQLPKRMPPVLQPPAAPKAPAAPGKFGKLMGAGGMALTLGLPALQLGGMFMGGGGNDQSEGAIPGAHDSGASSGSGGQGGGFTGQASNSYAHPPPRQDASPAGQAGFDDGIRAAGKSYYDWSDGKGKIQGVNTQLFQTGSK